MCIELLEEQDFCEKYIFWKTEQKELANSQISPLAKLLQQHFANSQPGAKFSAFPKSCRFVPRVRNCYWGSSSQSFTQ